MLRMIATTLMFLAGTAVACAQAPRAPAPCIGVMSAVGNTFALQKFGIMVFGNDLKLSPISSWGIDEVIVRKVSATLPGVKRLSYSPADLAASEAPRSSAFQSNPNFGTVIKAAAAKGGCDRNIAIAKAHVRLGNSDQAMRGLGIIETGAGTPLAKFTLFAVIQLVVVDGRTGDFVRYERLANNNAIDRALGAGSLTRRVDQSWWPSSPQVAGDAKLRDGIRGLIDEGLPAALKEARSAVGR